MVKVSILFYVYNVENFLKDSLNSLLNQSFNDFEVICIDDGSTDNSLSILKRYSNKDNRIKFISINHSGFSKAMNKVLGLTGGKYIYFMNPDGILKFYALGLMYETAEDKNTDIILSNINYEYDNIFINKTTLMNNAIKKFDTVFNYKNLQNQIFDLDVSLENKFFSANLIKDNNLMFNENLDFPEYLFFYNSLLIAKNIFILNDFLFENRKPFELFTVCQSQDVSEEYKLIQKSFRDKEEYENYKDYFLICKLNIFMSTYSKLQEGYKEKYFSNIRKDLINDFSKNKINEESIINLSDFDRKIFEQILISESSYEFDLLRKNYFKSMEYNKVLDRFAFLKLVNLKSQTE